MQKKMFSFRVEIHLDLQDVMNFISVYFRKVLKLQYISTLIIFDNFSRDVEKYIFTTALITKINRFNSFFIVENICYS